MAPNRMWRARACLANFVPDAGRLLAAMMLALECAPPRARVHLFGFNWSRRAWAAHKMGAEEAFARRLDAAGRIRIHWPACAGMRGCGGCAVRPCPAAVWTLFSWQVHCNLGCAVHHGFETVACVSCSIGVWSPGACLCVRRSRIYFYAVDRC